MDAKLINPFLVATSKVIKELTGMKVTPGAPTLSSGVFEGKYLLISVGIVGELRGQVLMEISEETGSYLATRMMQGMMEFDKLCDLSRSALSELMNMIVGNAATLFSADGITIDITPPSLLMGTNMELSVKDIRIIKVPLLIEGGHDVVVNVAVARR